MTVQLVQIDIDAIHWRGNTALRNGISMATIEDRELIRVSDPKPYTPIPEFHKRWWLCLMVVGEDGIGRYTYIPHACQSMPELKALAESLIRLQPHVR
jgi:hypothetical protein